jgi:Flp pilus assembly protein TadD/uncharacterized protein (AIM24 family)
VTSTPVSAGDVDVLDEEYLHHVGRGNELLARGDHDGAVAALMRARQLRPSDTSVLGLLGQALYRLGRFEESADTFEALVDARPTDAAARVNLGLAHLKAKRYPEAIRQLEVALAVQPDHQRALGYLGLAYVEHGDPLRARDFFVRAGSDAMVARCDELLAQAPTSAPATDAILAATDALPALAPGSLEQREALAAVPLLEVEPSAPFGIDRGFVVTRVAADVLVRADGLVAVRGPVRLRGAQEQQRGRTVDRPFGEEGRRMLRGSGTGAIVHSLGAKRVTRLELDGSQPACVCDAALFAFEGSFAYDNGRVASRLGADLQLVQLRGRGQALLASRGPIVMIAVTPEAPVRVPVTALAGWLGAVTPHFGALVEPDRVAAPAEAALSVELSGTGSVLVEGAGE